MPAIASYSSGIRTLSTGARYLPAVRRYASHTSPPGEKTPSPHAISRDIIHQRLYKADYYRHISCAVNARFITGSLHRIAGSFPIRRERSRRADARAVNTPDAPRLGRIDWLPTFDFSMRRIVTMR